MDHELIYIVDDEQSIRQTVQEILEDEGYSVQTFGNPEDFHRALSTSLPGLVLLDIWLPGANGVEVLKTIHAAHPQIPVIMMSGHAGIDTAVNTIKLGAYDFLEKPVSLEVLLDKVSRALDHDSGKTEMVSDMMMEVVHDDGEIRPGEVELVDTGRRQRTLKQNVVLNGTGLLSGRDTGIILSPLGENQGIVFQTLKGGTIKGEITSLENFNSTINSGSFAVNSTVLFNGKDRIRTVEHIFAVLHMYGITNVLIKADEEIPNIDGSALDFCNLIEEAGIEEQSATVSEIVIRDRIVIGDESSGEKHLIAEPYDGFEVRMRVNYSAPIFEQECSFNANVDSFREAIAPARSFNTLENIGMAQQMGKAGKGLINSHIILHEGKVINTELRFEDEFVRHKILDLIGDLYLLGHPVRGRFIANMTSHGYNQALARRIYLTLQKSAA